MVIEPIETAIRRVRRQLSEVQWQGSDTLALETLLQTLLAAQARGERWNIPF